MNDIYLSASTLNFDVFVTNAGVNFPYFKLLMVNYVLKTRFVLMRRLFKFSKKLSL